MGMRSGHTLKMLWLSASAWVAATCTGAVESGHDHAHHHDQAQPHLHEEIIVYARAERRIGAATSASEGMVGYSDYHVPPLLRVGELVEAVPGMVATQHSGTGKANQYFLRGFNLDHGTDFSAHLDGVPINMRSHGHGQGYLDLNFLIPELVQTVVYRKGVHHASKGDFSSAGSVDFSYYRRLPEPFVQATLGEHGYLRTMAAGSADIAGGVLTGAVDETRREGPWLLDEALKQSKFLVGLGFGLGAVEGHVALHGYSGRWNATDQIPQRAVRDGRVPRMGFVDPDLGGETRRFGVVARLDSETWNAGAYRLDYDFTLFSNFTYLLDDPVRGDEFEQRDDRTLGGVWVAGERELARPIGRVGSFAGAKLLRRTLLGQGSLPVRLRWGVDARWDDIGEVGLYGTDARARVHVRGRDRIDESSVGAYGEVGIHATERVRAVLGMRVDHYDWEVSALDRERRSTGDDSLYSPKLSIAYRLVDRLEAYANWGRGFHSNDVRLLGLEGDAAFAKDGGVLAASEGHEFGLRFEPHESFNASLVWFDLELDSELVYVGDAGVTEARDASERRGIEVSAFWRARDGWTFTGAFTHSVAEFATGDEVAGAVGVTGSLGVNALLGRGFHFSANARYLGDAPLNDDGSVRSDASWLWHAGLGWHYRRIELAVDVFNLFDSSDDDIAYHYRSRLAGEPAAGVLDTHSHPLEPRTVRVRVGAHL